MYAEDVLEAPDVCRVRNILFMSKQVLGDNILNRRVEARCMDATSIIMYDVVHQRRIITAN